ncbi:MAG: 50S ribosomal protein L21 [Chloroflexota bacterium]|nr:50S ribosomal protein L21 [Chloroflexota bacterium]
MFAVVNASSRQNLVRIGDSFVVDRVSADPDSELVLSDVLLIADDKGVKVGSPVVKGSEVRCKVVRHTRGPKIRVQRYKAKKHYERRAGHRQDQTVLQVTGIKIGRSRRVAYDDE